MAFNSRTLKLLATYTTNIAHPTQIVFDPSGNAYIEDRTYVVAYPNGNPTNSYKIKTKEKFPIALATAPNGDLYVSTPSDVEVFKTGRRSPSLIITSGVNDADHIAIGASGNLYVSNVAGLNCGSVRIYKLGAKEPSFTIAGTNTACNFEAISEGPDGNVYVATGAENADTSTVNVYSSGNPTLLRTMAGLEDPSCLGFDDAGNLYVGDMKESVVNVYARGSSAILNSISSGVDSPISLTLSNK
jgi:hypothetical protein